MKELSIEEKAKRYDEALWKAGELYQPSYSALLEEIFPELKEPEDEDEKIRKELIDIVAKSPITFAFEDKEKVLAWLEKQNLIMAKSPQLGEQKPADKIEPKFKLEKGKWYVCIRDLFDNYANKAFCKGDIYLSTQDGSLIPSNSNIPFEVFCPDTYFRDWNIQDAKDGDVLVSDLCDVIILFRGIKNNTIDFYCDYDFSEFDMPDRFTVNSDRYYGHVDDSKDIHPATKKQCDTLFKAIDDAGYKWNAEKKELKKIEQKPAESGDIKNVLLVHDEILNNLFERYKTSATFKTLIVNLQNWWNNTRRHLLSFNIEQKPTAWSEEDETGLTNTIIMLKEGASLHFNKKDITKAIDWLKSLRPQEQWKPSNEQINTLSKYAEQNNKDGSILTSLYQDLKKLRDE